MRASTLILAESSFPLARSFAMSFLCCLVMMAFLFCRSLIRLTHSLSWVLVLFGLNETPKMDSNILCFWVWVPL